MDYQHLHLDRPEWAGPAAQAGNRISLQVLRPANSSPGALDQGLASAGFAIDFMMR